MDFDEEKDYCELQNLSEDLRNDIDFITTMFPIDEVTLKHIGEKLKTEILLSKLKEYKVKKDESLINAQKVLSKLKENGMELSKYRKLNDYKDVVLVAVRQNGMALKYASDELKNDFEVVFEAVGQNGYALMYASEELKNNRNIVLNAIDNNPMSIYFASEELKIELKQYVESKEKEFKKRLHKN